MTDLQQRRSGKMRKLIQIKQELSNSEENEGDFINSANSPNHFNSQIVIKQKESCTSEAEEDSVPLNKITSLTCQVKTEPESEEEAGCELGSAAGNLLLDGFVIKQEIIELHTEDHPMMNNEGNHKTTKDEDSGTEADHIRKYENDSWSPNFPDDNIHEENNILVETKEIIKQEICGRVNEETEISLSQAKTCQTKKSHKCSVCAKPFHSSQACLQHMWNTHTGENPYTCEDCGKSFKYLDKLQVHKTVHSNERPYSCDVCKKAFKRKSVLQRHKVLCHSDERPYSCDLCQKTFKLKNHLTLHITTVHSNERPYSCDLCEKTFKKKDRLNTHIRTVHSDERPYSCDVCDKAFKQKEYLQDHKMQCHSDERPYTCDLCDKASKHKRDLQRHKMLCHSDERPYSCDLCKKSFKLKGDLHRHKRTVHSNEKPSP